MTVQNESAVSGPLEGDGSNKTFNFGFLINDETELKVIHSDANGTETVLTSNFTISGVGNANGGSINYPDTGTALPAGEFITMTLDLPVTQETNFTQQGGYSPQLVMSAVDKLTRIIQTIKDAVDRSVKATISSAANMELPVFIPDYYFRINSDASGVVLVPAPSGLEDSSSVTHVPAGTGVVARSVQAALRDYRSVFDLMTTAQIADVQAYSFSVDVTAPLQQAIDNGGRYFLPDGGYLVDDSDVSTTALDFDNSNVHWAGAGIDRTIIKLANAANAHVLAIDTANSISITGLTIDGNRTNQTASGHGIRIEEADNVHIDNVKVKECRGYGIGAQGGTLTNIHISNIDIENTGSDGIDFKNLNDDNHSISLDNIHINGFGLVAATQTGIDIRGPATLNNIHVRGLPTDGTGIRFRQGALLSASGYGAHKSSLSNFHIAGSGGTQNGVSIHADNVAVSNGTSDGTFFGVNLAGTGCSVIGVKCLNTIDSGIILNYIDATQSASNNIISGCTTDSCDVGIEVEGSGNILISNQLLNSVTRTLQFDSGADNNISSLNRMNGGVTGILDNGSGNIFHLNEGVDLPPPPLYLGDRSELTIASGAITISKARHTIDTEADAATDDLDTINGASHDGQIVILSSADSTRDPTVKDSTGNIQLTSDFIMSTTRSHIMLMWDATNSTWWELSRSVN